MEDNSQTEVKIISLGGPIIVPGDVNLVNAKGEKIDKENRKVLSICGCGKTKTSFFCDGSHSK